MDFGSRVVFVVKWAFATIPAFVLIWLIAAMLWWGFPMLAGGSVPLAVS